MSNDPHYYMVTYYHITSLKSLGEFFTIIKIKPVT